ncbi:MAG TPA: sigma-70 family RNA polymerase sigma factor [Candidatus Limnocylindrales bacterium]|nr:sigma-70 family RNA polymerase sigma factor [Candidatus Limnocylindrales bacterium]
MIGEGPRDEPRELEDARLVARIAAGDEAAFVTAYDRHSGFVFGSVARFVGDREVAAEVVQDAFLALWRRARQFDAASGSLLTWLLAIARHRAIDRLRAEGRRPGRDAIHLDTLTGDGAGANGSRPDVPPELIAGPATDPGTIASRRWVQAVVRTGISELPEHERQVILLGYGEDLSQSQIAERLEWPLGTVKSRTRRAMAQLRSRLGTTIDAEGAAIERSASEPAPVRDR